MKRCDYHLCTIPALWRIGYWKEYEGDCEQEEEVVYACGRHRGQTETAYFTEADLGGFLGKISVSTKWVGGDYGPA